MPGGTTTIAQHLRPKGSSHFVKVPGVCEALTTAVTPVYMLYVRAKTANTQNIYLGDSAVDKTSNQQVILAAGDAITITPPHGNRIYVNDFYIDADVGGEGVDILQIA